MFEGNGLMSQLLLEALDGFIMIVMTDGQLFYVSESVKNFLGYTQAALIHQSLFKFLHVDDHKSVKENLAWANSDCSVFEKDTKNNGNGEDDDFVNIIKREKSFTCRMKCTLTHGGGFYKMFQCRGKMREVHIKKRDGDNVQYGFFAVISPVNNLPSSSTIELMRKEGMMAPHRGFPLNQNVNPTAHYPGSPLYTDFLDPHRLRVPHTPGSEPLTPNDLPLRPSFFPSSFTYGNGGYMPPNLKKRQSSCSSSVNDVSSPTDENASSEGSCDGNGPSRRVSFFIDDENRTADGEKRETSRRRMSAPAFPSAPPTPSAYDTPYGGNTNWFLPSPLPSSLPGSLFSYQDFMQRMDTRPLMTPGLLSPLFPPFSPGGMFAPFSPNPFLRRNGSWANFDPSLGLLGINGTVGDNAGLISPTMRPPTYDPFNYFMNSPLGARRSTEGPINGNTEKQQIKEERNETNEETPTNEDDDVEINVTECTETTTTANPPFRKHQHFSSDANNNSLARNSPEAAIKQTDCIPTKNEDITTTKMTTRDKRPAKNLNDKKTSRSSPENVSVKNGSDAIQETLADIAQSFTSKLDSIRSSFTLSMDKNVASCIGKK